MDFRRFGLAVLLLSFLVTGDPVRLAMAQSAPRPEPSGTILAEQTQGVRARFSARIREMLVEAKALESAGKPGEAVLMGVRASRMLEVIGGERAWPRAGKDAVNSPAEYLAVLTERYDPEVLKTARAASPSVPPRVQEKPKTRAADRLTSPTSPTSSSTAVPAPEAKKLQKSTNSRPRGKSSSPFDRFPKLPAKSRSWVPVGAAAAPADDWKPVGSPKIKPSASAGPPVPPTPIPVFEEPGRGKRFGAKSEGGGVSDNQVGPIPVNLVSPTRPDSNAIDIRAGENATTLPVSESKPAIKSRIAGPLKLPGNVQPVPAPVPAEPTADDIAQSDASPSAVPSSAGSALPPTADGESTADSSQLWLATLIGVGGGVLLVLAGGFLVRRVTAVTKSAAVAADENQPGGEATESSHSVEGMTEAMLAASMQNDEPIDTAATPWMPGSSWGDSADSLPGSGSDSVRPADEQTVATQLQLYRGEAASAEPAETTGVAPVDGSSVAHPKTDHGSGSDSHIEPAVPFRVIGTDVVLGEAESARVDEELQQRREKILQRVLDENSAMRSRLDEQGRQDGRDEPSREAA